jgi:hypothetical protein
MGSCGIPIVNSDACASHTSSHRKSRNRIRLIRSLMTRFLLSRPRLGLIIEYHNLCFVYRYNACRIGYVLLFLIIHAHSMNMHAVSSLFLCVSSILPARGMPEARALCSIYHVSSHPNTAVISHSLHWDDARRASSPHASQECIHSTLPRALIPNSNHHVFLNRRQRRSKI